MRFFRSWLLLVSDFADCSAANAAAAPSATIRVDRGREGRDAGSAVPSADSACRGRIRATRECYAVESVALPANPYFFRRSISDPRLRPNRRAASDWLPATEARVRAMTLRSSASTCSRRLRVPSGGGSAPGSAVPDAVRVNAWRRISPPSLGVATRELRHKGGNVFPVLVQRWNDQLHHGQAVVEVLAKAARARLGRQIPVGA